MECSVSMKGGIRVYGIDNQGHGKSDGIKGFISHFNDLVEDCSQFFTSICERNENKNKLRILLGESMGGAMVLRLHLKKPDFWDGGVLVAPMCKVFTSVFRSRPDWPIDRELGPWPVQFRLSDQMDENWEVGLGTGRLKTENQEVGPDFMGQTDFD
ncbi:putative 2-acylglycerol O-acyltransferase [Helianthus annuus]|nr:putative 2-acylglycerol O-acyltransferase [Helianthus annuus]